MFGTRIYDLKKTSPGALGTWERNRTLKERKHGSSPNYFFFYNTMPTEPLSFNGYIWTTARDRDLERVQNRTATFDATWSESYDGNGSIKPSGDTRGMLYQGKDGSNRSRWGIERSLIGFNTSEIQETLKGTTITKIELYLKNEDLWYREGGKAAIIAHNFSSRPNEFNYSQSITDALFNKRQGRWVPINISIGDQLKSGAITGFGLYKNSDDLDYYGHFAGATSDNRPRLRVTYRQNTYVGMTGNEYLTDKPSGKEPEYYIHVVKEERATIHSVAKSLGVSQSQLRAWNNLSSAFVYEGNRLKVYKETSDISRPAVAPLYTSVKQGENLDLVATRLMRQGLLPNNLTSARSTLMSLNGYRTSNPLLYPGDQIMYSRGSS